MFNYFITVSFLAANKVTFTVQQDGRVVFWDVREASKKGGLTIGLSMATQVSQPVSSGVDREDLDLFTMVETSPKRRPESVAAEVWRLCFLSRITAFFPLFSSAV